MLFKLMQRQYVGFVIVWRSSCDYRLDKTEYLIFVSLHELGFGQIFEQDSSGFINLYCNANDHFIQTWQVNQLKSIM